MGYWHVGVLATTLAAAWSHTTDSSGSAAASYDVFFETTIRAPSITPQSSCPPSSPSKCREARTDAGSA